MFVKGQRVNHTGHGDGEIIEVRAQPEPSPRVEATAFRRATGPVEYAESDRFASAIAEDPAFGARAMSLMSWFGPDRYPYRVRYDSGYEDVYAESDLSAVVQ